ncbi:hypothetical protein Tco_1075017 [Tanacetum coccineum]
MYHKKNVDYAHLLWEDFFYQVENKNVKRSNEMYYPRFTKVIVNFFMTKDSSIPRRNRVNWQFSRDDPMFTTRKVVSRHEDTQLYGAILPDELTNEAMKDSESYKEYYVIASGAEPPKTKASVKKKQAAFDTTKTPLTAKGKRLKTSTKVAKPAKKKQPAKMSKAKSLRVLSEIALTEAEQMKLAIKRRKKQTHSSYASGSGADEGTGVIPGVPDVPTYNSDDEQISWKSNNENDDNDDDDDDDDGQDHEGQDDDNEQTDSDNDGDEFVHSKFSTHDEEDKEEDSFDPRVQTPSHVESTDDEDSDEEIQEGRDTEMTDAPCTIIQTTQVIEDTNAIITPVNLEGIDSIFNLNTESTSLVDVLVTTIVEPPLLSAIILPLPPTPLITHLHQTPVPIPATILSSSLQDLPTFAVSLIPGIVDAYLANKMHETTVNEQLKAEVLTRSSNESKTSHAVAANLSELELKNILIDKMERDTEDKPNEETSRLPDWFQKLAKPPTPDRDWNKTLPTAHGPVQPWLSTFA